MLAAASLQASSDREVSKTLAPAATKLLAIIRPIPLDPPVINTFFPFTENNELIRWLEDDTEAPARRNAVAATIVVGWIVKKLAIQKILDLFQMMKSQRQFSTSTSGLCLHRHQKLATILRDNFSTLIF